MKIDVIKADYLNERHAQDSGALLDAYARDPMGGGKALPAKVLANLATELARIPHAFSVLCYADSQPAGLANCFTGFSTFQCKPLVNIHDLIVLEEFRGLGLGRRLLEKVEELAREMGACKITLEVLENNTTAQKAYSKFGFEGYELDSATGKALFWQKPLDISGL